MKNVCQVPSNETIEYASLQNEARFPIGARSWRSCRRLSGVGRFDWPEPRLFARVDIDQRVTVFGLSVKRVDFVQADRHRAVVVPPDRLPHLETAIITMQSNEALILRPARGPDFDFSAVEVVWRNLIAFA